MAHKQWIRDLEEHTKVLEITPMPPPLTPPRLTRTPFLRLQELEVRCLTVKQIMDQHQLNTNLAWAGLSSDRHGHLFR